MYRALRQRFLFARSSPVACRALLPVSLASAMIVLAYPPLAIGGTGGRAARSALPSTFIEVSASLGISVTPTGDRGDWGHGAAFCDYDNDNDLDLYVVMGAGQPNRLFENRGAAGFVDVAVAAGVADAANGRAVVWADYDNDGDKDIFVSNYLAPSRLYSNNGDGSFTNIAASAGIDAVARSHSAAWADYDNDGYLDLFVGNYGIVAVADPNYLYHNNGDSTFTEVAAGAGVADSTRPALACTWVDYDNDNDLDLYIAYDKLAGNALYENDGLGNFTDVSAASNSNIAFNAMGIAVGDYDHNGYFDMYVTNTLEGNELLHNNGNKTFNHAAASLGVTVNKIGWGTAFLDYDNDGDEDLYVMNFSAASPPVNAGNVLLRNDGGAFTDVSVGSGAADDDSGFAVTTGDFNNDGYLDMFVNNQNHPSKLYQCVPGAFNWLKIKTVGTIGNRDGIGAKIRVVTGGLKQLKDVRSGSSYLSGLSPEVEFGVGTASNIDSVEVTWPSGLRDLYLDVAPNQFLVATEGSTLRPVPVFITRFLANPASGGIELSWEILSDEAIGGFRVYRRQPGNLAETLLNRNGLLNPLERRYVDREVQPGQRYEYALAVIQADGSELRSALVRVTAPGRHFGLEQNFPNPFNPTTTIRFALDAKDHVLLTVFDVEGRRVATLADEVRSPGPHEVTWNGRNQAGHRVSTGIYFYRLQAGERRLTRKMILLK